jgi:Zn-dependent peptidase ImmA (M78 family)
LKELVDFLGSYFDYPQLDLPSVELPSDPLAIQPDMIEEAAYAVRQYWDIQPGPMPDILEKIEGSGILVSRIHVHADKVDAFSQWSDKFQIPFIVLSRDKASAVRQRFDALHELFHILAHRHVTKAHLNNRQTYKLLEKQADTFASFVLMPEADFVDELYAPTLDGLLSMKERWGVSVAAMIMRCKSLDLLDDSDSKRMWINYTRRGWRKGEPFDGKTEKETPHLIRRSFEMLLEKEVFSASEILKALPLPVEEIEELADLEPGTLGGPQHSRVEPTLKPSANVSKNVVSLFQRD